MNAHQNFVRALVVGAAVALIVAAFVFGQSTQLNLATQAKGVYLIPSGPFASMPKTCVIGQQYQATDQPLGQQLYLCCLIPNVGPRFMQQLNLDSVGLKMADGSLGLDTAVVPLMGNFNDWGGLVQFENGISLAPGQWTGKQPDCNAATRFAMRPVVGASGGRDQWLACISKDGGATFSWVDLVTP